MKQQSSKMKKALAFANVNTKMKMTEIAKKFGVQASALYTARYKAKKAALKPVKFITLNDVRRMAVEQNFKQLQPTTSEKPLVDNVNHPAHYKAGGIETIDFIEAKKLNYNLGNVVKYITRSDLKGNRKEDLQKALWYLKRELGE